MKSLLLSVISLLTIEIVAAQTTISIDSVSQHIGEKVIVCDEVYGVKTTDKVTFINVGAKYPHAPLTIVIFRKDLDNNFTNKPELYNNQAICVTGVLKEYKGKTEIVVTKQEDIQLLDRKKN